MQLQDSTMCLTSLNLLSNMTSAYLFIPSTIMAHQHAHTKLDVSSLLQTHYILNAVFFILSIGFLSWSLDSHHDVDVVPTGGDVRVLANTLRAPSSIQAPSTATPAAVPAPTFVARPTMSARQSLPLSLLVTRQTLNFSARRQTCPNTSSLKMLDFARQRHSLRLPSAASSPTAQSFGIEGTDVLWSIPSIDEVRGLKSLPISPLPTTTPHSRKTPIPAPAVIVVDAMDRHNKEGEAEVMVVRRDSAHVLEEVSVKQVLAKEREEVMKRAERRSRSWKTRTLIRLRIPVQWML